MTNYEANKKEFEKLLLENGGVSFSVVGNKAQNCFSTKCSDCIFYESNCCDESRKEWLKQEYPYTIPADTPVDTKVLVSQDGIHWEKRYFSHFSADKNYLYACFECGATSWSVSIKETSGWKYCKLYEEEN